MPDRSSSGRAGFLMGLRNLWELKMFSLLCNENFQPGRFRLWSGSVVYRYSFSKRGRGWFNLQKKEAKQKSFGFGLSRFG